MKNSKMALFSWILIFAIAVTELIATIMMGLDKSYFGIVVHLIIGIAIVVIGLRATSRLHFQNDISKSVFSKNYVYTLLTSNLVMLLIISIHDVDHMRQAMGWGYQFTIGLLLVNIIVYLPNLISIYLVGKDKFSGIIWTAVSGPIIAVAFLKLHLLGAWIPVWGPWNRSFFALGVDKLSWWILVITAVAGIVTGMIAIYCLGRIQDREKYVK
ncbi:hypothetical protein [Companilactobacillus ginsenosidimutans]|nr:hypothetical protein [Companilactobacillus ginsenosidimutans]